MSPKHPLLLGFQFWFESGKGCRVFICIQIDNSYSKFKKKSNGVFLRIYISRGSGDIFILIKEGRIFGNPMKVVFFKSILCIFWILFYFIYFFKSNTLIDSIEVWECSEFCLAWDDFDCHLGNSRKSKLWKVRRTFMLCYSCSSSSSLSLDKESHFSQSSTISSSFLQTILLTSFLSKSQNTFYHQQLLQVSSSSFLRLLWISLPSFSYLQLREEYCSRMPSGYH